MPSSRKTAGTIPVRSVMLRICLLPLIFIGNAIAAISFEKLPDHPRLFANEGRFEALRKETADHEGARDFQQVLRTRADALLKQPPAERVLIGKRLLQVSRQALECITVSAMAGKLDGNSAYKERAIAEMRALANFPDWNPSHFLDVAEATFAMGVGYDWLYHDLTPEDRDLIATAIIDKGLKPSLPKDGKREHFWVRGTNNWNQVCHSGMTIGALAVADREPDLAKLIVGRAVEHLNRSASAYAPDGIYPEGPGYWAYGTAFHVTLVEALRTSLGDSFGLEKFPGFLKTADYIVQMEAPSGRFYNYADNGQTRGFMTPLFWFARELKRPELVRSDLKEITTLKNKPKTLERMMPLALIWWDAAPGGKKSSPPSSWIGEGKVPLAVFRQDWDDPASVFLAAKGGKPDISHGHMDIGSFIVEADGSRWAEDLGLQSYNTLESRGLGLWDYRQNSQRWNIFRLGPDAHNIPRINGARQNVSASAKVVKSDVSQRAIVFDLTPLYAPEIATLRRGLRLAPAGEIVIRDEWKTAEKPAVVSFQWLTRADVKISDGGAVLTFRDKSLRLAASSETPFRIEVDDLSKPANDYDEPNPRLKRIRIILDTKAGDSGTLTVVASKGETLPEITPLDAW